MGEDLVGFVKMVLTDDVAAIMQINIKVAHQDKKITNAMVAKAVEFASEHKFAFLAYCKYSYHKNIPEPLQEFKRRNGFLRYDYPRYFVPLSRKGRLALALRLHQPKSDLLPTSLLSCLLKARAKYYEALSPFNQRIARV
jgi:hypothetical protein